MKRKLPRPTTIMRIRSSNLFPSCFYLFSLTIVCLLFSVLCINFLLFFILIYSFVSGFAVTYCCKS